MVAQNSRWLGFAVVALCAVAFAAVLSAVRDEQTVATSASPSLPRITHPTSPAPSDVQDQFNYNRLRQKITYGNARLADARRAMRDPDPVSLSNTIHALFTLRHQRGVLHLIDGMWRMNDEKYPELAWNLISNPPARIALASTINRIRIVNTQEFQSYIRSHKSHPHEFVRAQVAVALGFNGALEDLPYLRSMSDGNNHYVAQSAITGLSVFSGDQARDVLIELAANHKGTQRGALMVEMLRHAYRWPPAPKQSTAGSKE